MSTGHTPGRSYQFHLDCPERGHTQKSVTPITTSTAIAVTPQPISFQVWRLFSYLGPQMLNSETHLQSLLLALGPTAPPGPGQGPRPRRCGVSTESPAKRHPETLFSKPYTNHTYLDTNAS